MNDKIAKDAEERAREIVHAVEWSGDMRANMNRAIGAGRVLAKRLNEEKASRERIIASTIGIMEKMNLESTDGEIQWVSPGETVFEALLNLVADEGYEDLLKEKFPQYCGGGER